MLFNFILVGHLKLEPSRAELIRDFVVLFGEKWVLAIRVETRKNITSHNCCQIALMRLSNVSNLGIEFLW